MVWVPILQVVRAWLASCRLVCVFMLFLPGLTGKAEGTEPLPLCFPFSCKWRIGCGPHSTTLLLFHFRNARLQLPCWLHWPGRHQYGKLQKILNRKKHLFSLKGETVSSPGSPIAYIRIMFSYICILKNTVFDLTNFLYVGAWWQRTCLAGTSSTALQNKEIVLNFLITPPLLWLDQNPISVCFPSVKCICWA